MAGDPSNASLWADADVYVGATTAANPADVDTPFGSDWDLVGLLNGDNGFSYEREWDTDDKFAWGGVLVRTSRRNFKQTVGFTALEDNETTRSLIWPGSTATTLKVPRPQRIKIAFETREGDTVLRRIAYYQAEVEPPNFTDNEQDLTEYELTATIYPDSDGNLFVQQKTEAASS